MPAAVVTRRRRWFGRFAGADRRLAAALFCFVLLLSVVSVPSLLPPLATMVLMSVLNSCLVTLTNAERRGKRQVLIRPVSKVVVKFLQVMMKHGYIGEFELIDDKRSGKIVVQLIGRINKAGVISPRFDLALSDMEKWTSYLLPSGQFGHLVLTTSYGIMDHQEAIRKHTGGKILGYFY
jgi:small subunit ribosomal protein S15Ae